MDKVSAGSPLIADWTAEGPAHIRKSGIDIRENPDRRKLIYTTDGSDAALRAAVVSLGAPLPDADGTTGDDPCCLWRARNRWMIVYEKTADLDVRLKAAANGLPASVVDVSDAWLSIQISGRRANHLLTRGCELDLHQRVFGKGRFAESLIAKADVLIHSNSTGGYEVFVDRTLAVDLWVWLKQTAQDLGE